MSRGRWALWNLQEKEFLKEEKMRVKILILLIFSLSIFSYSEEILLLKNANIITVTGKDLENGDILIKNGKIFEIGKGIQPPRGAKVIDLNGKWVMPGIIDSHSHIAVEGGVNETGNLISAEVDVEDVLNPEDISIFYALTGGVTTIHTMHGSANPIGGKGIVLKLRWGKSAKEMIFKGAPKTIKWALGENPKQSNFSIAGPPRYPTSRMGVEESIRKVFEEAKDYMRKWDEYNRKLKEWKERKSKGMEPIPPKKDYRLEAIADVLRGKLWIRCHAYQAQEMLSIMKLCHEYGVKLVCFEHGLEGYKITKELVKYNVAVSTFADFWAYKWEAFNTMPYSAAMMAKNGVLVAMSSDDSERMRRLFSEAAKAVRFGGLSELEALKMITINPAKILGVEKWVGTIEVGKDADLAIFNKHPLDPYTICEMTIIDGEIYFDRAKYLEDMKKKKEEKEKKNRKA